jgi:acyl carrier protein
LASSRQFDTGLSEFIISKYDQGHQRALGQSIGDSFVLIKVCLSDLSGLAKHVGSIRHKEVTMAMDIVSTVYNVLHKNTVLGDRIHEIDKNDNLLEQGMDSLQIMRVVVELERAFNFEFSDEDLLMANFNSINSISNSVRSILATRSADA